MLFWCNVGYAEEIILTCDNDPLKILSDKTSIVEVEIDLNKKVIYWDAYSFKITKETQRKIVATRNEEERITIDRYSGEAILDDISKPFTKTINNYNCIRGFKIF